MPLFRSLKDDEKFRVMSALDAKLTALMETRVKLRERRQAVILSTEEDFEIETQLLRLDQVAGDIVGYKDALLSCEDDLRPPSTDMLDDMRRRVQRIRAINVTNATASAIIVTATDVIGAVPTKV